MSLQAATTKILPTKCLNIAEPRVFCPPKITHYSKEVGGYSFHNYGEDFRIGKIDVVIIFPLGWDIAAVL